MNCLPRLGELKLPCLLLQGTADEIAPASRASSFGGVETKSYDGMLHGLFVDEGREAVVGDLVTWLESQV